MTNAAYALLAHSWSGLVVAAAVAVLGWLVVQVARWLSRRWVRFIGYAIYFFAALLALGSVVAIVRINKAEGRYPPMGKLVDMGGYRIHILTEGDARGGPTLIWIPGAHSAGLELYHLHKAMRAETRSILFDRPGTGWSDTGPFPRTTAREADELAKLLDNAGERGPFILIGHSYGGLLAANYARRHQDRTTAVVLLDATPPDVFEYLTGGLGPGIPVGLVHGSRREGWSKLFGLWSDPSVSDNKQADPLTRLINERLADVTPQLATLNANPALDWTAASIFEEWSDPKLVADLVVYDGELGDLPVFVVTPGSNDPKAIQRFFGWTGKELERAMSFLQHSRMRYLSSSKNSTWIGTPAGTEHNFPYQTPDFVVSVIRRVLTQTRQH